MVHRFPHTSHQPLLRAKKSSLLLPSPSMRVAALFSGGQAPGGHNVLAGIFDALKELNPNNQLIGFLNGTEGMLQEAYLELTAEHIARYRNQGGFDLLGSGRTKIGSKEQLQRVLEVTSHLKLDGIIIIGGDDSQTNSAILAEYLLHCSSGITVIGVPKTIDGDLQNSCTAIPFGFDTATKIYAELIGNIAKDALSSKKYYHFIKLMGRTASHVALECSLKVHPNLTLISEENKGFEEIVQEISELVIRRAILSKNFGILLIPEGIGEQMIVKKELSLHAPRDPHGNVQLSEVAIEKIISKAVQTKIGEKALFHPLSHFFGYEGRSGLPTNFDANYSYTLGKTAVLLTAHRQTSYMAFVKHLESPPSKWEVGGISLVSQMEWVQREGATIPVIKKTLVDLQGTGYQLLQNSRSKWALQEKYQVPGPIQFFGNREITDTIPLILKKEPLEK